MKLENAIKMILKTKLDRWKKSRLKRSNRELGISVLRGPA